MVRQATDFTIGWPTQVALSFRQKGDNSGMLQGEAIELIRVQTSDRPDTEHLYQRHELVTFVCPFSHSDGHDCVWLVHEAVPSVTSGLEDGVVVFEDAV